MIVFKRLILLLIYILIGVNSWPTQARATPTSDALITQESAMPFILARANGQGVWWGQGRIVEGSGKGGIVQLKLHFDGQRLWTSQGPPLNHTTTQWVGTTVQAQGRTWTFKGCGSSVCVVLQQGSPRQVVRYRLTRQ